MKPATPQPGGSGRLAWAWPQTAGAWVGVTLGLAIVLGWHTSVITLLRRGSGSPLASYGAGWALLLAGAALESARRGWRRTAIALSAGLLCLGGFSLFQHGTGFSWSLEKVYFHNPAWEDLGPAIISPTGSLCAFVWALSLLLDLRDQKSSFSLKGALSITVAVCSAVSLAGYTTGLPSKAEWGAVHVLFMSFLPALGYLALSVGLLARQLDPARLPKHRNGWPMIIFTLGVVATLVASQAITIQRDNNLAHTVQQEALSVQSRILGECDARMMDLASMARRWAFRPPREAEWEDDVNQYVSEHSGTVFLEWVDPAMTVRWLSPRPGHEKWVGLKVKSLNWRKNRPYELADASGKLQLSGSFPILDHTQLGMVMVAPIPRKDAKGGYLVGVIYVTNWLSRAVSDPRYQGYGVTILEDGKPIFRQGPLGAREGMRTSDLDLPGVRWKLQLIPGPTVLAQHRNTLARGILGAGLIFSGLMAFLAHLARTARTRQEGFRASEARLRAVFEASPAGIVVLDREGGHTQWNQAWCAFLGYSSEELATMTILDFSPPEEHERVKERLEAVFSGSVQGYSFERSYLRKDGEIVWGSVATSGLLHREGAEPSILIVVQDITTRKKAEDALHRTQANLEDAQRLAHIGSWDWGVPAGLLTWSTEQFRIFGEDPQTYIPTWEAYLGHLPEGDRETIQQAVQAALHSSGEVDIEHRILRPDGQVRTVHEQGRVAFGPEGHPLRMFGTTQDITERKRLERLREDFVSVVSHELRTPLTSIRGSLGLLGAFFGPELPEKGQELLRISTRNCDRLVLLINDLLDIQKIESGSMAFDFQREDLRGLVEEAIRANEGFAANHGLGFTRDLPLGAVWIRADRHRLIQVVTNLLSNAAKFGGTSLPVEIRLEARNGLARLEIQDHGAGIPEGFQDRIFQKFAQADEGTTRASGGTGLGLSIVKAIIEQHGGHVGFDTRVGEGTTFWLELHLWEGAGELAAQSKPMRQV